MEAELVHLFVYICSDGTLMCYNPDKSLNIIFSDFQSWKGLHKVYKHANTPSKERKGMPVHLNIKYIKYYFKNVQSNVEVPIPETHIPLMLQSIES